MTKAEQARIVAWRLRILRWAQDEPRHVARTCRHFGISRTAFYRWKRRFDAHGEAGLGDRPRTPQRSPRATPREVVSKILYLRQRYHFGPGRIADYQSQFHWHAETLDIRHVYIRPRTPRLNGKVERSHRVDDQEFYQLLDRQGISDDIHLFNQKLREWEDYYNYHRPHGALDGQTPYERLLAKTRAEVSPGS
jgi:transposase InsO family protein